jgi:hypothetical protein
VSSASAERALSKLKIVKNRLRSRLCDDMTNSTSILNYICCSTSAVSVTSLPVTCSTTRFILLLNVPN